VALGLLDAVLVRLVRLVMRRVILRLGHPESLLLLLLVTCGSTKKSGDEQSNQEEDEGQQFSLDSYRRWGDGAGQRRREES